MIIQYKYKKFPELWPLVYMYKILVIGALCTSECASECRFSANLCRRALDVTADVIVEATRNADVLTINVSEDFQ